ncbi:DUF4179 domain-containing protein [Paenibacillus pini]|uniref:ECF-type sigma factor negative effector n=1 Tax=Paenibacillus pini JCM 16418 TaxID=1236976 RepID=W7YYE5_9BACL|nr:DUF4179 domain-containing protein [Paenibacillus pini]GAF07464.1 ECF-type sigma factor negative effector [Paenibacillus pini JCM 16418]
MKLDKKPELDRSVMYTNLSASLQQEAREFLEKQKFSVPFDDVWTLHINTQEGTNKKYICSPFVKWSLGIATAALICFSILIGSGFMYPQVAEALRQIPFFDYLYAKGGYPGGLQQIEKKNLSTQANATIIDQKIKFTMVDIFYDGMQVVLNYEVNYPESSPKITEKDASVYYDTNFVGIQPSTIGTHQFTITGDHSFVGTTLMSFGDSDLPDKVQLHMSISKIGRINGKWDVTVPLSKEKSDALTTTFHPNKEFVFMNKKYLVEKLVFGPANTQLLIKGGFDVPNDVYVIIEDDLGTLINMQGGSGSSRKHMQNNFSPLSELNPRPKYVTLIIGEVIRITKDIEQYQDRAPFNNTFPLVLKGDQGGEITLTYIEFQEKQTVVYYKVNQSASQSTSLMFEDNKGGMIFAKERPIRISKDSLYFKLIFPKMNEHDVAEIITQQFSYPPDREMLRIKIPLIWK